VHELTLARHPYRIYYEITRDEVLERHHYLAFWSNPSAGSALVIVLEITIEHGDRTEVSKKSFAPGIRAE
jgi:hypothetical protein